jgi:hypothetical protein
VLGLTEPVAGMFSLLSCFSRFLSFRHLLLFHVQRSNIKVVVTYLWYLSLKLFHSTDEETKRMEAYMKKAETTEMKYCPRCRSRLAVYVTGDKK